MKTIYTLLLSLFLMNQIEAQTVLNLKPSSIKSLDFSQKTKDKWSERDKLLENLNNGILGYDQLNSEQQAMLEEMDETKESMWDIVGGGCSWYCGGGPYKVTASSQLKSQGNNSYNAENAHDLNYKHAWVEGKKGYGIGEYLLYHFQGSAPITEIIVVNGYVKSYKSWKYNSRVKKLKVYINDKPFAILNLQDKIAEQSFKVEPLQGAEWTMKFEIMEVYKGDKYDDVVISEIYFDGIGVHCFAKGTQVLMANGKSKPIETLNDGDQVATYNHLTREFEKSTIEKLENVKHCNMVKYVFESGKDIVVTQDHPFLINDRGWASLKPEQSSQYKGFHSIKKIQIGDNFITNEGYDKLISIEYINGTLPTYTISKLSSGQNFIANGFIVGVETIEIKE